MGWDRWGRVSSPNALEHLGSSRDRGGRMVWPGDTTEEQPDDLVADQLVDDPVVAEDRLRTDLVEVPRNVRNSVGLSRSPIPSTRGRQRTGD